jgi:hypothetical protein
MRDNSEIKEMFVSFVLMFAIVFFAVLPLTNVTAALKLAFFYCFLFYFPFLPLVYSFKGTNGVEKSALTVIFGIGYVALYSMLDVFLKIRLNMVTYLVTTIIIFIVSSYHWSNSKH